MLIVVGATNGLILVHERSVAAASDANRKTDESTQAPQSDGSFSPAEQNADAQTDPMRALMLLLPFSGSRPFGSLK